MVLDGHIAGERVTLTEIRTRTPRHASSPRVAEVLAGTRPAERRRHSRYPGLDRPPHRRAAGRLRRAVRAWLLVLLDGGTRARPRSHGSIYVYFSAVQPLIQHWSADHGHLREVTRADVQAALDPLQGHQLRTTIAALRSLFRFAKKRGLIFTNPATGLKTGDTGHSLLPMTDAEIRAVERVAISPAQRLIVALAAIHAARSGAIRHLTLDDLDLPNRRITIAGHSQRSANSPTRPFRTGSPSPLRMAPHPQPPRPDLRENRPRHRARHQQLPQLAPAAVRRHRRTHPPGPGAPRSADRPDRTPAPDPRLRPVTHHRQQVRPQSPKTSSTIRSNKPPASDQHSRATLPMNPPTFPGHNRVDAVSSPR